MILIYHYISFQAIKSRYILTQTFSTIMFMLKPIGYPLYPTIKVNISFANVITTPPAKVKKPFAL